VEESALSKEKDPQTAGRLEEVRRALATLEERLAPLMVRYRCAYYKP
jgi:hypothetical protein